MFFVGLSFSLIALISGIILLLKESYLYGGILLGVGCLALILLAYLYVTDKHRRSNCLTTALNSKNPPTWDCDCNLP